MKLLLDGNYSPKVRYACEALKTTLSDAGETLEEQSGGQPDLLAGTPDKSNRIRKIAETTLDLADKPESLAIGRDGEALIVAGRDDQGLMYALLEVAEQTGVGRKSLSQAGPVSESPQTALRGMYIFLHNADCEREWFYSREHWQSYFDLLARSRYNSFHIVMAHQTNYLAPPFPFFVSVPEHPEVTVPGLSSEDRARNLEALRMITELAEERGLAFMLGIWEVIAWKPETRHGTNTQTSMVDGLGWDNLESYTYHATRRLLADCPKIKGIQLRVNPESGVPPEKQTEFFAATVFKAIQECDREVFLDLRGWHAHPQTIRAAKSMKIPMRISMKYWAEHLGAPYQAAKQNPAYSYADFLRYPQECPISYQVWALGSHRNFVWGDPEYVKTFCRSLTLGDGIGFETCPQLAQKGYGNERGAWRILNPEHEYYRWEWERYWLYHMLFGRLTYNADAPAEVWMRHMEARFGDLADDVMSAYQSASRIISFIMRFNMSDPNMYIWPEADTGGVLDFYIEVPPSDPALIKSFREAANEHLSGEITARMNPGEASGYLRRLGEECVAAAGKLRPATNGNRETISTLVDVEALGELALFHAEKILAAEQLALYYAGGDYGALRQASEQLPKAAPHWQRLVEITDGVYTDHQVTGPIDSGHWKDKLSLVREDEERLAELVELHRRYGGAAKAFDFGGRPDTGDRYSRVGSMYAYYVEQGFVGVDGDCRFDPRKAESPYGWISKGAIESVAAPLARFSDWHLDTVSRDSMRPTGWESLEPYRNNLYSDYVWSRETATFATSIPAGQYEVIVILGDRRKDTRKHGPFDVFVNGDPAFSEVVVEPGEVRDLKGIFDLGRGQLTVTFIPREGNEWFASGIVIRPVVPVPAHVPPRTVVAGQDAAITVSATSPHGIANVTLCLASDGGEGTRKLPMSALEPDLLYRAALPATELANGEPLEYWFEAESKQGRRARLPSLSAANRNFHLRPLQASARPPRIEHEPIENTDPGRDIVIRAEVRSERALRFVRLHYRYTNQYYDWQVVPMHGGGTNFEAAIPGDYIVSEWDLMYYLEAVDEGDLGSFDPEADPVRRIPYWVVKVRR